MQRSTKRLLSVLAVLALVLTMAPAGILAVETKADVQSNIPDATATLMATEAAKQTAAKAALAALTGTDAATRVAELNTNLTTCPFCGIEGVTWEAVAQDATSYGGTGAKGRHWYAYGEISKKVGNAFHCSADNANLCLLMDNATITSTGRFLMNKKATLNIGGTGSFKSDMSALNTTLGTTQGGMFALLGAATVNLYGGTFENTCTTTAYSGYNGFNRALLHSNNGSAVTNIWTDDVVMGPETAGTTAKLNMRIQYGTINMYGGTVQNSYVTQGWTQGWNVFVQNGTFNMYGGTVKDGKGGTTTKGGNVCLYQAESRFNMYGGTVTGGVAQDGGNIYMAANSEAKLNGLVEKGSASNQGGNVSVQAGATLNLGNVDLKNGTITGGTATLSSNVRLWGANLNLYGNANVPGNILMTSADSISVESTFSGETYVWQTAGVTLGGTVVNSSAGAAYTGHVYNGAWQSSTGTYIPVEMMWDGAAALKYPNNGIVYNGSLRGAASAQAAVDAFVAAMADEEVTTKPQYVMIDGNVNIGDAEVAIDALADITVTGTGTVYGVDRANDAYDANGGSITVAGPAVAAEVKAGGRRYIALNDATGNEPDKYTFHRVEAKLTNITVNVDNAGLYYKASYNFDETVKERVVSYGVLVKLDEAVTAENYNGMTSSNDTTGYAEHTLTAASHGVFGVFKDSNNVAKDQENGQRKLFGNPYLAINTTNEDKEASEYPLFAATSKGMSMFDAMELANTKWDVLSEDAQGYLNTFVNKWNAKGVWTAELLEALTNFTIA